MPDVYTPIDKTSEEEKFLKEHLLTWVPALCKQIRKFDTTGFYKGLADITEGWIYYDRSVIGSLAAAYST